MRLNCKHELNEFIINYQGAMSRIEQLGQELAFNRECEMADLDAELFKSEFGLLVYKLRSNKRQDYPKRQRAEDYF